MKKIQKIFIVSCPEASTTYAYLNKEKAETAKALFSKEMGKEWRLREENMLCAKNQLPKEIYLVACPDFIDVYAFDHSVNAKNHQRDCEQKTQSQWMLHRVNIRK